MEQFRIEVADTNGMGHFYNIKALDHEKYQIYIREGILHHCELPH